VSNLVLLSISIFDDIAGVVGFHFTQGVHPDWESAQLELLPENNCMTRLEYSVEVYLGCGLVELQVLVWESAKQQVAHCAVWKVVKLGSLSRVKNLLWRYLDREVISRIVSRFGTV
jgi:hypothetical protein